MSSVGVVTKEKRSRRRKKKEPWEISISTLTFVQKVTYCSPPTYLLLPSFLWSLVTRLPLIYFPETEKKDVWQAFLVNLLLPFIFFLFFLLLWSDVFSCLHRFQGCYVNFLYIRNWIIYVEWLLIWLLIFFSFKYSQLLLSLNFIYFINRLYKYNNWKWKAGFAIKVLHKANCY